MIVDFHTHTFPDSICEKVIRKLSLLSRTKPFTDASISGLLASMKASGVDYSVNLPVMTTPDQVAKINASTIAGREDSLAKGIVSFGGMHPLYEDYKTELKALAAGGVKGIKLHPAYQGVDLDDIRFLRIIECAAELDLIVLIHAGIDVGIYDHNYSSTDSVLKVVDTIHPKKFVLAHMGGWGDWENVEKYLAGADVYFDTAFAVGAITQSPFTEEKPILAENLNLTDFARIVRKHGADKILFATDSPWEDQTDYIGRINAADLTDTEKEMILGGNAAKLLKLV